MRIVLKIEGGDKQPAIYMSVGNVPDLDVGRPVPHATSVKMDTGGIDYFKSSGILREKLKVKHLTATSLFDYYRAAAGDVKVEAYITQGTSTRLEDWNLQFRGVITDIARDGFTVCSHLYDVMRRSILKDIDYLDSGDKPRTAKLPVVLGAVTFLPVFRLPGENSRDFQVADPRFMGSSPADYGKFNLHGDGGRPASPGRMSYLPDGRVVVSPVYKEPVVKARELKFMSSLEDSSFLLAGPVSPREAVRRMLRITELEPWFDLDSISLISDRTSYSYYQSKGNVSVFFESIAMDSGCWLLNDKDGKLKFKALPDLLYHVPAGTVNSELILKEPKVKLLDPGARVARAYLHQADRSGQYKLYYMQPGKVRPEGEGVRTILLAKNNAGPGAGEVDIYRLGVNPEPPHGTRDMDETRTVRWRFYLLVKALASIAEEVELQTGQDLSGFEAGDVLDWSGKINGYAHSRTGDYLVRSVDYFQGRLKLLYWGRRVA